VSTPRRGLLLLTLSLGACTAAAVSACLLPGCIDLGRLEVAWESWQNRVEDVKEATRTLDELEQKHGTRPFEGWPALDRARHAGALSTLQQLGEER
jgi:hypothetical protein